MPAESALHVITLAGIPEIRIRDDLGDIIGNALQRTPGALPLTDADGRIMRSTVRAVADELASAAELVLGKSDGRPVALVRGAAFTRGEGSIRDVIIPRENNLFP